MNDKTFADTNVLVYLFDRDAPAKQRRAREILASLRDSLVISTQVLQEFYVSVTRKLRTPLPPADAEAAVHDLAALDVVVVDVSIINAAMDLARQHGLSLWDALIVEAARTRGCTRLLSEDLQHGRVFGKLRIEDPFADR
jgi:predicted nucleic acid-binding protein